MPPQPDVQTGFAAGSVPALLSCPLSSSATSCPSRGSKLTTRSLNNTAKNTVAVHQALYADDGASACRFAPKTHAPRTEPA